MGVRSIARRAVRRLFFDARHAQFHFIHIPKNAGQSVRRALSLQRDVSLGEPYHSRYVDVADAVGRHLRFFAVVRNPWSRTASRYHFGRQNARNWRVDDPRRQFIEKATFADFVRQQRLLPIPEHPDKPWMGPLSSWFNQLEWIRDERGAVACQCLRMEFLQDDLRFFLNRSIALERRNTTKGKYDYRSMYTDGLADVVAETFREDIEYFGFTFDGPATRNVVRSDA
jgi:hypothetical protein